MKLLFFQLFSLTLLLFVAAEAAIQQPNSGVAAPSTNQSPVEQESDELHKQVVSLFREKKFKEALPLAKRAVELREKTLGLEHTKTLAAQRNLAAIYSELNKHGEAADVYQRVLKAQEKLHGPNSVGLCELLNKLGWERAAEGNLGAAEGCFKRELQIRTAAHGAEHHELLPALGGLAAVAQRTERNTQAAEYYRRMLSIKQKQVGEKHLDVAELYVRIAIVLRLAGKQTEADDYDTRARELYAALGQSAEPTIVPQKILQGTALLKVQPHYPAEAKSARVQGTVHVQVRIDETGTVIEALPVSGPPELRRVSVDAARKWRFKPTAINGAPIKVQGVLTFHFTLQ